MTTRPGTWLILVQWHVLSVIAGAAPPVEAVVLFDGSDTSKFVSTTGQAIDWPVDAGALVSTPNSRRSNNLVSRLHFRDAEIHVEFMLPPTGDGNSGVYVQGVYEVQILNSPGRKPPTAGDMGAIYGLHAPLVNAGLAAGKWQILDIRFRAPRRDDGGKLVTDGAISVWLNGSKIHDRAKVGEETSAYNPFVYDTTSYLRELQRRQQVSATGPLVLQDHDNPVRFRNIWVKPLDEHAILYDPQTGNDVHTLNR